MAQRTPSHVCLEEFNAHDYDRSGSLTKTTHFRYSIRNGREVVTEVSSQESELSPGGRKVSKIASHCWRVFNGIFLPEGYPKSVRPEYLEYQIWDTIQALSSYLRGILTTKAMLEASGVGSDKASALAATIAWVIRDGFGIISSLFFSYYAASNIDSNAKEWRIFADVINDVGYGINMIASVRRDWYLPLSCLASACYALCGISAGCSKATITAHFALQGNMADLNAKENAQETAVTLIGMVFGIFVAKRVDASPLLAWAAFLLLTALHVHANWRCVACLRLETLNPQRAGLALAGFWAGDAKAITPQAVAARERLWRPLLMALTLVETITSLQAATSSIIGAAPQIGISLGKSGLDANELRWISETYRDRQHAVVFALSGKKPRERWRPAAALAPGAGPRDELLAFLQLQHLAKLLAAEGSTSAIDGLRRRQLLQYSLAQAEGEAGRLWAALGAAGWSLGRVHVAAGPWRCAWGGAAEAPSPLAPPRLAGAAAGAGGKPKAQ